MSLTQLHEGDLGFTEKTEQQADMKSFDGIVPASALAYGKVEVEFTPRRR